MVTHMYQQQCSACWVGDGSGDIEGVVIRKARGHYLACPEPLIDSPFAAACAALNVQVPSFVLPSNGLLKCSVANYHQVCHDRELESSEGFLRHVARRYRRAFDERAPDPDIAQR